MKNAIFSISSRIGDHTIVSQVNLEDSGIMLSADATLLAADAGALTVRTDEDEGTITLSTGHGIETANKVDLYWTGGARYNVLAGTVSGNSVPVSGGSGDALPAQDAVISVAKRTAITFTDSGDNISAFMAQCDQPCRFAFMDASGEVSGAAFSVGANQGVPWYEGMGYANPVSGATLVNIEASTSASVNATFQVDVLGDVSSED